MGDKVGNVGETLKGADAHITLISVRVLQGGNPRAGYVFVVTHIKIFNPSKASTQPLRFDLFETVTGTGLIIKWERYTPNIYVDNDLFQGDSLAPNGYTEGDLVFQRLCCNN